MARVRNGGAWTDTVDVATQAELDAVEAAAANADNLTSGTVADARIAATIARDSEVTSAVAAEAALARNADNLTSGTVADARIASTIARDSEVTSAVAAEATARDAAIATHEADTTNVHGITDTSVLETTSGSQSKADAKVSDTAYDATSWNGVTTVAPSKNAVRDQVELLATLASPTFTGDPKAPTPGTSDSDTSIATTAHVHAVADAKVSDTAFAGSWDAVTDIAPSKNAVYDKVNGLVDDTAYDATSWNGDTSHAPSKNAVRDKIESLSAGGTTLTSRGAWAASTAYAVGDLVTYGGFRFLCLTGFTSGTLFDPANWIALDQLTIDNPATWTAANAADQEFSATSSSLPSGWSWVNQGGASYDEQVGAGAVILPSSGGTASHRWIVQSISGSSWTATGKFSFPTSGAQYIGFEFILRQSSNGHVVRLSVAEDGSLQVAHMDDSSQAGLAAYVTIPISRNNEFYMRITKTSSTSWKFEYSAEGVAWLVVASAQDISGNATPDQIGFGGLNMAAATNGFACQWLRVR